MTWFYASQGQQVGPVEQGRFEELVRTGVIREDTLVWREGLDGWRAYGRVRGVQDIALPAAAPGSRHYGGFWIRFVAKVIDGLILAAVGALVWIPFSIVFGLGGMFAGMDRPGGNPEAVFLAPAFFGMIMLMVCLLTGVHLAYQVYFLTTRQATPGKMALGLKVIRADGQPGISAGLAIGRFFAEWVTNLTFYIGYIIAGFDSEKRALHDHICGTRVIYAK